MNDNTIFFVGRGPDPTAVRNALAQLSGIEPASITLADPEYDWADPAPTVLSWEPYAAGDFGVEYAVMTGGARLHPAPWSALAQAIEAPILLPDGEVNAQLYAPEGSMRLVTARWPEESGGQGPVLSDFALTKRTSPRGC